LVEVGEGLVEASLLVEEEVVLRVLVGAVAVVHELAPALVLVVGVGERRALRAVPVLLLLPARSLSEYQKNCLAG